MNRVKHLNVKRKRKKNLKKRIEIKGIEPLSPEQGYQIEKEALRKYRKDNRTHYTRNFFILTFLIAAILESI